jgi:hypothetical protein
VGQPAAALKLVHGSSVLGARARFAAARFGFTGHWLGPNRILVYCLWLAGCARRPPGAHPFLLFLVSL